MRNLHSRQKRMLRVITFAFLSLVFHWQSALADQRPNIIMFLIDDQNPSSISTFGGDTYTPNLDRMAKEGRILFDWLDARLVPFWVCV